MTTHAGREINSDDEMGDMDDNRVTEDDLLLLADLFYLPFEHGAQAIKLLEDFRWLRRNAALLTDRKRKPSAEKRPDCPGNNMRLKHEWKERAKGFEDYYNRINRMCLRITNSVNRNLVYELFPYFWDLKGMLSLLNSFVKWLGPTTSRGLSPFADDIQESWIRRGGLYAEFQRLLPLEVYTIRPYLPDNKRELYEICQEVYRDDPGMVHGIERYPDLIGDYSIGGFLRYKRDFCFVIEDDSGGICGYVVCTPDAKTFAQQTETAWRDEMRKKYAVVSGLEGRGELSATDDLIGQLHFSTESLKEQIYRDYPAQVRLNMRQSLNDPDVVKRLLTFAFTALEMNGATGVHVVVDRMNGHVYDMLHTLGFSDLSQEEQTLKSSIVMARIS